MKKRYRITDRQHKPFIGLRFDIFRRVCIIPYIWYDWNWFNHAETLKEAEALVEKDRNPIPTVIVKEY